MVGHYEADIAIMVPDRLRYTMNNFYISTVRS